MSRPRSQIVDTSLAPYESARLSYRAPQANAARMSPDRGEAELASYPRPADAVAPQTVRTLAIQYPHPSSNPGYARVELVVEAADSELAGMQQTTWLGKLGDVAGNTLPGVHWSQGIQEAWALDIPRAEFDQLLVRLRETGYFHEPGRTGGTTEVTAQVDGVTFCKAWEPVPELDGLVQRVRREGSLTSYTRTAAPQSGDSPAAPSAQSFLATLQRAPPQAPAVAGQAVGLRRLPPVQGESTAIASGSIEPLRR